MAKIKDGLSVHIDNLINQEYEKRVKAKEARKRAVKKYNNAHYSSLQVFLDKELISGFKALVKDMNLKQADIIRYFITEFMLDTEKHVKKMESESYQKQKQITNFQKYLLEQKAEQLTQIKDEKSLYYAFEGTYRKLSELNSLADYFGIKVENRKSSAEIKFNLYNFLLSKIKKIES